MEVFKKEDEYIVLKISDIDEALFPGEKDVLKELLLKVANVNPESPRYAVVSDKDKDIFEYILGMEESNKLKNIGEYNRAILKMAESEYSLLNNNVEKLNSYINSVHYSKLSPPVQLRLSDQLTYMMHYRRVLLDRIMGDLRNLVD